jgi:hypothetical protein
MVSPGHSSAARLLSSETYSDAPGDQLSLGYSAFQLLYEKGYLRYSQARLGDAEAGAEAVSRAFIDLRALWGTALSSASPEAAAWSILGRTVTDLSRPRGGRTAPGRAAARGAGAADVDLLHRVMPVGQADAVVLCRQLGMSVPDAASLMGAEPPLVGVHLMMGERSLSPRLAAALELRRQGNGNEPLTP